MFVEKFHDEMLHQKTFEKKRLIVLGSKWEISIFQTTFTKSKNLTDGRIFQSSQLSLYFPKFLGPSKVNPYICISDSFV